jgi:hypothetical protein
MGEMADYYGGTPMAHGDTEEFENVVAKGETEKAVLCEIDGEDHWIPKSQIDDDSEVYAKGHTGTLVITRWLAEQKNLV